MNNRAMLLKLQLSTYEIQRPNKRIGSHLNKCKAMGKNK